MSPPKTPLRIVVTDDSAFMRRVLADGLSKLGFEVVGEARSGEAALEACRQLTPDAVTLDLTMPGLDGLGVLRELGSSGSQVPVVVVSSFSNGMRAVDALAAGAIDLVAKPSVGEPLSAFLDDLAEKLETAAEVGRRARNGRNDVVVATRQAPRRATPAAPAASGPALTRAKRVVVIASSTGGPKALAELVPRLPAPLGEGSMIVQHMPAGFTASLAERLDRTSKLKVEEATSGARLDPSTMYLCPGGNHMRLSPDKLLQLTDEPPVGGLRPRADVTIADAARLFGERLLLVVLTGMGRDGADGAKDVKRLGGRVLCEAESTCTVWGMPRAVEEAGLADAVLPLGELPVAIAEQAGS